MVLRVFSVQTGIRTFGLLLFAIETLMKKTTRNPLPKQYSAFRAWMCLARRRMDWKYIINKGDVKRYVWSGSLRIQTSVSVTSKRIYVYILFSVSMCLAIEELLCVFILLLISFGEQFEYPVFVISEFFLSLSSFTTTFFALLYPLCLYVYLVSGPTLRHGVFVFYLYSIFHPLKNGNGYMNLWCWFELLCASIPNCLLLKSKKRDFTESHVQFGRWNVLFDRITNESRILAPKRFSLDFLYERGIK